MAIPQLSAAERQAALEKAKAARIKRAEVRDELKSGKITLAQVIEMKDDPVIGRMKVSTLIETLPSYGKAKAEKVMKELQIAESRRLRGLGERQQAALLERLAQNGQVSAQGQPFRRIGAIGSRQRHLGGPTYESHPRWMAFHFGDHACPPSGRDGGRQLLLQDARAVRGHGRAR